MLRRMQKIDSLQAEWKYSVLGKCVAKRDSLNWTPLQRCEVEFLSPSTDRKGRGGYDGCEEGGLCGCNSAEGVNRPEEGETSGDRHQLSPRVAQLSYSFSFFVFLGLE